MLVDRKIAVIGLPGKWSTETLADSVYKKTGFRLVVDMSQVSLRLNSGQLLYQDDDLSKLDALIIKKISKQYSPDTLDRLELLRVAQNAGVKIFSQPESIIRLIDRLSCTITLKNAGIAMPATVITESVEQALETVDEFGMAIFKPLYSTKARGMCLIGRHERKQNKIRGIELFKANNPVMYIQQKIELGDRDMGLMFLGGQYIGAYARVSKTQSWNTTIHSGGKYAEAKPSAEIIQLAQKAQQLFDLSYTTVDIAETEQGPVVFEVSAFGGFRGAREGLGVNVADMYVDYVLENLSLKRAISIG